MFKCDNCGFEFDEPDFGYEDMKEFWGSPCTRRVEICPSCKMPEEFYEIEEEEELEEWEEVNNERAIISG